MNIRDNITNYLFDRDYLICAYDDHVYIYNYTFLENFSDTKISVKVKSHYISITGKSMIVVKVTKEEMLIKGSILSIKFENE